MTDTIAAISTAMGESGIGIVRMSGKNSLDIGGKIFKGKIHEDFKDVENRKLTYGHIYNPKDKKIVDEVLIVYMKSPHTYTREDIVEIYCHGGAISVKKILELLLENGARLAEPGEFTKRAFLNGRLDLSQAEAVIDLIRAKTDKSYDVSLEQLEGSLSFKIEEIRNILLEMLAHVEVSIDFPDEDIEEVTYEELENSGNKVLLEIDNLLSTADKGRILRDGLNTVILGKPNVGKSSLLNAILRENRAIVTDVPGTTRDIIEEYVNIDGIPLKIVDTAGIRSTEDLVEKIGVDRAKKVVEGADLVIGVFDASRELSLEDKEIIELLKEKNSIVLLNKTDLPNKYNIEDLKTLIPNKKIILTAIAKDEGIEELEETIKNMFYSGDVEVSDEIMITNIRHKNQLIKAKKNIEEAIEGIKLNVPLDCVEVDIRNCWDNLGEISGDTISEDILDKIFSEFCIGK
ncbi:tRNA uridine-5-carboxymethylaminomethyl(34) synthesis GTPase MnmE [Anaerosalibacter bizertensis]|uniref:tRNA modification GTPase MnmE n=1 Tax=Anaerosalibacter bizertensis TaxID=932217 RepID=A0A9Q4FL44_9FIRM|nr:tRNA uridine-5-carboxymethylaminomethyl(34) synthesis GTPase MnmE [Anaerosalibacter bizertensis]MCG4565341.1 tRNA uridine-5-carboxymethylaminomethyl(34) synthesis GTPase MnmE [Anaerosalibacter bizertensis]MCG4582432.1 tRNA uridine-5-carboxymethylaminomethyl(34) synthesis GTPase MnmE [Anaerosalibacter bizertensis]